MPTNQEALNYIHNLLQQGYREADIKNILIQGGWPPPAADQAFRDYYAAIGMTPSLPTPVANPAPAATPSKKGMSSAIKLLIATVIALALATVAILIFANNSNGANQNNSSGTNSSSTNNSASRSATPQQRSAKNTARATDANQITAGVATFMNNNSGNLARTVEKGTSQDTLNICGDYCDINMTTIKLIHYSPENVAFKSYQSGLKAPDAETVYIVNEASCNQDGSEIVQSSSSRSVAILYAIDGGSKATPKCVSF